MYKSEDYPPWVGGRVFALEFLLLRTRQQLPRSTVQGIYEDDQAHALEVLDGCQCWEISRLIFRQWGHFTSQNGRTWRGR